MDTFEHFRRNDRLLDATESFITISQQPGFKTDVIELFAGKYNMDVDIVGPDAEIPFVLQYEFPHLSRVILSHQSVALKKMSLDHRFNISMRFVRETPAEFLDTVGLAIGPQLVSLTDSHGASIIHWAAKRWATLEYAQSSVRAMYADFVSKLVEAGSLVSAVDKCGQSPIMYILGRSCHNPDDWPWSDYYCSYPGLVQLVKSWGSTLAGAGVSLHEYIETENSVLEALKTKYAVVTYFRNRSMIFTGLCFGPDGSLAMESKMVESVCLYAEINPPGTFVQETETVPRVCLGSPPDDNELWQQISFREVVSKSSTLHPSEDSLVEAEFEMDEILFRGTQDDHGTLTAIFRRNEHRLKHEKDAMSPKERSSSAPPSARRFIQYSILASRSGPFRDLQTGWLYHRGLFAHKCPHDSKWGFNVKDVFPHGHEMWRTCMKGCRGRPNHAADIPDYLKSEVIVGSWEETANRYLSTTPG